MRNSWLNLLAMSAPAWPGGKTPHGGPEKSVAEANVSSGDFMKRHGNLYPSIVAEENLKLAFIKARRGKSWQNAVQRVERNLRECLENLRQALLVKTFNTSPYRLKIIHEPKTRTIYRLPFYPDRIVQHALMNIIEPIWDGLFIADSYACRQGKGLHAGSRRTMEFVRKYRYCLKGDVSQFYPSIDHDILFGLVQQKVKCPNTLWLFKDIIYSLPGGKNIPIGNYTSQWFGNLYLNELDRLVKHDLKIKGYVRYCDDFCLFHNNKKMLHESLKHIKDFLGGRLKLKLSKEDVFPVSRGVDFLGYRHFPKYLLLRKSTSKRVKARLAMLPGLLARGKLSIDQFRSSLASTLGWLKWANTYNFRRSLGIDELWETCLPKAV